MTENGPSTHYQVRTAIEHSFVDHEVLLLPSEGSGYFRYILVEVVAYVNSSFVQGFQ